MKTSLREFKEKFLNLVLELLWRQWTVLGVSGHAAGEAPWMIVPEALLLASCTFGRWEPRLFDEALDWLACWLDLVVFYWLATLALSSSN